MIPRILTQTLIDKLNDNKLVVLRGPRKSGRLTLLQTITDLSATGVLVLDGEKKKVRK
jgi:predicted AAA+ superfamily ATPase